MATLERKIAPAKSQEELRKFFEEWQRALARIACGLDQFSEQLDQIAYMIQTVLDEFKPQHSLPAMPRLPTPRPPQSDPEPPPLELRCCDEILYSDGSLKRLRVELEHAKNHYRIELPPQLARVFRRLAWPLAGDGRLPVLQRTESLVDSLNLSGPHSLQGQIYRLRKTLRAAGLSSAHVETWRNSETRKCEYRIRLVGGMSPGLTGQGLPEVVGGPPPKLPK